MVLISLVYIIYIYIFHLDIGNGTADQQRRRNSSIAKLLGGHPLNNHQYEGKISFLFK